jgi:DNA-binding GntR family transcriptional regulator
MVFPNPKTPQGVSIRPNAATLPAASPRMTSPKEKTDQGLSPAIAEELKRLIFSGEIQPGARLNEAALALRMGTSRGPIREAIRLLTGQGLVTAVPNRGVFVRQISVREMLEIYELRALIFGFAAERACEHLDEASRAELQTLLARMDAACEAGDATHYYELNLGFHAKILQLCGNERASQAYDDHVKELHLFRRSFFNSPGNMRRSNAEHSAIFEAIAKRDPRRARALAERHVLSGRDRLLARLDRPA